MGANRKVDNIEIVAEDKTSLLREERRKELEEISNTKVDIDFNQKSKETLLREERAKELFNISNRTTDAESEMRKSKESILREERAKEIFEISNRTTNEESEMEKSEQIWNERAEELKQITSMRSKSPWQQECRDSPTQDRQHEMGSPELKGKIRNTAAAWKEREKESRLEKDPV